MVLASSDSWKLWHPGLFGRGDDLRRNLGEVGKQDTLGRRPLLPRSPGHSVS